MIIDFMDQPYSEGGLVFSFDATVNEKCKSELGAIAYEDISAEGEQI